MKQVKCSIREVGNAEARDTTFYNIEVKIGDETFQVEGDDRSGWDDECTEQIDEYLTEIGSDLTFDDLMKMNDDLENGLGDEFEINVEE